MDLALYKINIIIIPRPCLSAIRVISNNFTVRQIFQGLVRAFSAKKHAPYSLAPFVFDPRTRSLVCNGLPGHIQFYSVDTDKQLFSVSVRTALEIWCSCQIFGGLDIANCKNNLGKIKAADRIYLLPYKTFEKTLQYIHFIEKDMILVKQVFVHI